MVGGDKEAITLGGIKSLPGHLFYVHVGVSLEEQDMDLPECSRSFLSLLLLHASWTGPSAFFSVADNTALQG